jgi:hypothetical protein
MDWVKSACSIKMALFCMFDFFWVIFWHQANYTQTKCLRTPHVKQDPTSDASCYVILTRDRAQIGN